MVAAVSFRKRYCGVIVLFLLFCFLIFYSLITDDQMSTSYLQNYGSVVGWEFNRTRNASDYILPDTITSIIEGKSICSNKNPPQILLIVCSKIVNFDLRNAIRNTWAYFPRQKFNVTIAFLMGLSTDSDINSQVKEESVKYKDVIVENFIDTYNNLTLKTLMLLKWVKNNCDSASFVMKTDDDIYVNVENLVYFINHHPKQNLSNALLGQLVCGSEPVRDSDSKWFMPRYIYANKLYPNYLSGYGYLMSINVALRLYEEAFSIPIIHMEDVFFTGLCAHRAGIKPSQPHLFRQKKSKGIECTSDDKDRILFRHEISYEGMFLIHHFLKSCNSTVPQSFFRWLGLSRAAAKVDPFKADKYCEEWKTG